MRHPLRVTIDAEVSAADVVRAFDEDQLTRAWFALEPFTCPFGDESPSLAQRVVSGLLECPIESEYLDDARVAQQLLNAGADVPRWLEVLEGLRVRNAPGFCQVWDRILNGIAPVQFEYASEDGELACVDPPSFVRGPQVYTVGIDFVVPAGNFDASSCSVPRASSSTTAVLRPATIRDPELEGLAARLRPRIAATFSGVERLGEHPVLAPICAVVASVSTAIRSVARRPQGCRIYRPEALAPCLAALGLGPEREVLERILFRDHPDHLHIDVSDLPAEIAPRSELGMFARDDKGRIVDVTREARRQLLPRVLFSLAGPDPY